MCEAQGNNNTEEEEMPSASQRSALNNRGQNSDPNGATGGDIESLLAGLKIDMTQPLTARPTVQRGIRPANPLDPEVVSKLNRSLEAAKKGGYEGWLFGGNSAAYGAFIGPSGTIEKWVKARNAEAAKAGANGVFVKVTKAKHEQSPNTYDASRNKGSDLVLYWYGVETMTPDEYKAVIQAKAERKAAREAASV